MSELDKSLESHEKIIEDEKIEKKDEDSDNDGTSGELITHHNWDNDDNNVNPCWLIVDDESKVKEKVEEKVEEKVKEKVEEKVEKKVKEKVEEKVEKKEDDEKIEEEVEKKDEEKNEEKVEEK